VKIKKKQMKKREVFSFVVDSRLPDFMECYTVLQLCNDSPVL